MYFNVQELLGQAGLKTTQWQPFLTEITRRQLKGPSGNLEFTQKEDKLPANTNNQK
jgi:hypothetical protein